MKKYIYPLAVVAALTAATSCNDDDVREIVSKPDSDKEMISFSLSDGASSTRAGFTGSNTAIAMRIQSNEKGGNGVKYTRTVAEATKDAASTPSATTYSTVSFTNANTRYWDDAHGRKSLLSVFAVAIPNGGASITNNNKTLENLLAAGDASKEWGTNDNNKIEWVVSSGTNKDQKKDASTETTPTSNIDKEDLVYSNNIQADASLGKDGIYRWDYSKGKHQPDATGATTHKDGRMLFFQDGVDLTAAPTDAPGHFDKGHLKFNHALSRITVTLKAGEGFAKTATGSFILKNSTVQFLNMNVKGTLDIPSGLWTLASSDAQDDIIVKPTITIDYVDPDATPKEVNSLSYNNVMAQMLPGYIFKDGDNTNVVQFTLDDNTYYITQDMIYDALSAVAANLTDDRGYTAGKDEVQADPNNNVVGSPAVPGQFEMKQGKNYSLTITIGKKQIEAITATLAEWDIVSAAYKQDNTHITISTSKTGSEHNDELNLFKMEQDLGQIYTDESYFNSAKGFSVFQGDYKTSGVADLKEMKKSDNTSYSPKQWYADGWYYKDNQTAYHLRTLNNLAADEGSKTTAKDDNVVNAGDPAKSYFTMKNGAKADQDYHWGAPMKATMESGHNLLEYSNTEGYTSSIHPGFIAPANGTSNAINITELHMMSNINVVLKTSTGTNAIKLRTVASTYSDLEDYNTAHPDANVDQDAFDAMTEEQKAKTYNYATVKITKLYKEAEVDMGTGLVTPKTVDDEETMTQPSTYFAQTGTPAQDDITTTQAFTWAVVPQALKVTTGTGDGATTRMVGITITTPDNNEYYIIKDLSEITATVNTSQIGLMHTSGSKIIQWYPNHTYNYTFTLSKKGIEAITCTLADWVTVEGTNTNITLEN